MIHYHQYHIKATDHFTASDFPKVQAELDTIVKDPRGHAPGMKGEIILSYVKDHSLKKEWLEIHPELTTLLTGRHFTTVNLEALLESSRQNKPFRESLEAYIRQEIDATTT